MWEAGGGGLTKAVDKDSQGEHRIKKAWGALKTKNFLKWRKEERGLGGGTRARPGPEQHTWEKAGVVPSQGVPVQDGGE